MDENDAEEVHKPLGLMRAILRIKAAEVQGARGSSHIPLIMPDSKSVLCYFIFFNIGHLVCTYYRGLDMQFVTRAEHRVNTDNKVAAKPNDEQNTNLKADDVKKDEIYEARFVCDQEVAKMVEMEVKDSKQDEWNEKEGNLRKPFYLFSIA